MQVFLFPFPFFPKSSFNKFFPAELGESFLWFCISLKILHIALFLLYDFNGAIPVPSSNFSLWNSLIDEWMNIWIDSWIYEWMDRCINECMDEYCVWRSSKGLIYALIYSFTLSGLQAITIHSASLPTLLAQFLLSRVASVLASSQYYWHTGSQHFRGRILIRT